MFPTLFLAEHYADLVSESAITELDLVIVCTEQVKYGGFIHAIADKTSCIVFGRSREKIPVAGTKETLQLRTTVESQREVLHGNEHREFKLGKTVPPLLQRQRTVFVSEIERRPDAGRGLPVIQGSFDLPLRQLGLVSAGLPSEGVANAAAQMAALQQWFQESSLADSTRPAGSLAVAGRTPSNKGLAWFPSLEDCCTEWVAALTHGWASEGVDGLDALVQWSDKEWFTVEEMAVDQEREQALIERAEFISASDAKLSMLDQRFAEASAVAVSGARRLLTASGTELEEAVINALLDLGFDAVSGDSLRDEGEAKMEDVVITCPGFSPDWLALAEVKGLSKGAKLNDLIQLGRCCEAYAARHGRPPAQRVYIVNANNGIPPQFRPKKVLAGQEENIAVMDALVLPTTVLFQVHRSRKQKDVQDRFRQTLLSGKGVMSWPLG